MPDSSPERATAYGTPVSGDAGAPAPVPAVADVPATPPGEKNTLYYGDNLDVLRRHLLANTVDLVYLDPPFNSNADYNVLFSEQDGSRAAAQIKAFGDTWRWDAAAVHAFKETVEAGGQISNTLQAFRTLLGDSNMLAYLSMMAPRLVELHRVLKPSGSLYLHCDPTASHYLKLMLDAIFGPDNFRNEIVWRRTGAHNALRSYGPIHDTLLFYTKTNDYWFKPLIKPYMKGHAERRYTADADGRMKFTSGGNVLTGAGATKGESGQPWRGFDPSAKHRHWAIPGFIAEGMPESFHRLGTLAKLDGLYDAGLIEINEGVAWPTPVRYLDDDSGQPVQDIWAYQPYTEGTVYGMKDGIDADVKWLGPTDPERLGFPTQKPLGLLARVVLASCPERGIVLDPFCGCGTAISVAQDLGRHWIGIDITHLSIALIKSRLRYAHGRDIVNTYRTIGEPTTVEDAAVLAKDDPFQFQAWALGLVGARPAGETKKGGDKGIDGKLFFHDEAGAATKVVVISVKAGKLVPAYVRDLRGVIDREKAAIGVLISFDEPTPGMRAEAAEMVPYESPWRGSKHARLQLLSVGQLLAGHTIDYPAGSNVTIKRAAAPAVPPGVQTALALGPDPDQE